MRYRRLTARLRKEACSARPDTLMSAGVFTFEPSDGCWNGLLSCTRPCCDMSLCVFENVKPE